MITNRYQLKLYPDYILRSKSVPVDNVDGSVRDLMDGLAEVMYTYKGIGLAAPQVGVLKRVIIADIGEGLLTLANPEIIVQEGEDRLVEGCLSLPDIQVDIARAQSIFVQGISPAGDEIKQEVSGLMARVIQHEVDHLDGRLIIDYASPTEKIFLRKKLQNLKKQSKKDLWKILKNSPVKNY
jgi:peptide deformylase